MTSLAKPKEIENLIDRLERVEPDMPRRWGTMTAHEMLCHLGDSFLATLGERPASSAETWMSRSLIKWIALHTSLPWPQGVPTRPEVNPHRLGTKPDVFLSDRTRVVELIRRFASNSAEYGRHPAFGALTRDEWLVWAYRHVDHHLRQFGQ